MGFAVMSIFLFMLLSVVVVCVGLGVLQFLMVTNKNPHMGLIIPIIVLALTALFSLAVAADEYYFSDMVVVFVGFMIFLNIPTIVYFLMYAFRDKLGNWTQKGRLRKEAVQAYQMQHSYSNYWSKNQTVPEDFIQNYLFQRGYGMGNYNMPPSFFPQTPPTSPYGSPQPYGSTYGAPVPPQPPYQSTPTPPPVTPYPPQNTPPQPPYPPQNHQQPPFPPYGGMQ